MTDRDRITAGSRDAMLETAYDQWAHDIRAGKTSVLIAATTADVSALNARARLERALAGQVEADGIVLHDGNLAGVGEWVVTRTNARTLRYGRSRWVHNGDVWQVTRRHRDGSLTVRHLDHRSRSKATVRLPRDYVADSVELGYACTSNRAQGATVDTAHALVTAEMTREGLYVASTRGRDSNRWYVASDDAASLDCDHEPEPPRTVTEVLDTSLRRTGAELSATQTLRTTTEDATRLSTLVARFEHARSAPRPHSPPHFPPWAETPPAPSKPWHGGAAWSPDNPPPCNHAPHGVRSTTSTQPPSPNGSEPPP